MLKYVKQFFDFLFSKRKAIEPKTSEIIEKYKNLILQLENSGYTTQGRLKKKLTELNWQHVTYGTFSYVYLTPCKQFILRVGSSTDNAYPLQAYHAICHVNNPYYCNVYALVFGLKSKRTFTFMEPLDKIHRHKHLSDIYDKSIRNIWRMKTAQCTNDKETGLDAALSDIKAFAKQNQLKLDLHSGNVMVRNGKDIVFTDPFI